MRTRKTDKLTKKLTGKKTKIWNQIGLSKFKFKLRVKKLQLNRTSNCENGEKSKTNRKNCFKCTQQFLKERTDTDRVEIHDKRSSSKQEHKGNALASGAEERRDKLR